MECWAGILKLQYVHTILGLKPKFEFVLKSKLKLIEFKHKFRCNAYFQGSLYLNSGSSLFIFPMFRDYI